MKLFSATLTEEEKEERKADQGMQIRLFAVLILSLFFTKLVMLAVESLFGKDVSSAISGSSIYTPFIINLINILPRMMRLSWAQLILQTSICTILITAIYYTVERLL